MQRGDHIRVWSKWQVWHEAIYIGDDEVIEHAKPNQGGRVRRLSLRDFVDGDTVQVVPYNHCDPPEVVVRHARSALGKGSYALFSQNCEHFARWCKTGQKESKQLQGASVAALGLILVAVLANDKKRT